MKFSTLYPKFVIETFDEELARAKDVGDNFFITQFFPQSSAKGDKYSNRLALFVRSEFAALFNITDDLVVLGRPMWEFWGHYPNAIPKEEGKGFSILFETETDSGFRAMPFCLASMPDLVEELKALMEFERDPRMITYSQQDIVEGLMEAMNESGSLNDLFARPPK